MNKKKVMWLAMFGLATIMIVVLVLLLVKLSSQGSQCIADPISYYQLQTNASCFCDNFVITP